MLYSTRLCIVLYQDNYKIGHFCETTSVEIQYTHQPTYPFNSKGSIYTSYLIRLTYCHHFIQFDFFLPFPRTEQQIQLALAWVNQLISSHKFQESNHSHLLSPQLEFKSKWIF